MRNEKIVRLFISSTFSDFTQERDRLREQVFPKLERYCEEHGGRFQAVDLRWGVSRDDSLTHKTMELCLSEIEKCQEISSRPNLLIMIGNRYGWEPIPNKISQDDFNQIASVVGQHHGQTSEKLDLLHKWYRKDENSEPAEYVLVERTDKFQDQAMWFAEEGELLQLLREAAFQLGWNQDPAKIHYFSSATEQEIVKGIDIENPNEHVIGIIRNSMLTVEKEDARMNTHAQERLLAIKGKLRETIPSNLLEFDVSEEDGYSEYLDQFCQEVEASLIRIIDGQVAEWETDETEQILSMEMEKHRQFSDEQVRLFTGREQELEQIQHYINKDAFAKPMFVIGESGTGKSAMIAKAAADLRESNPDAVIISRFIGNTSSSFNPMLLVQSITEELLLHSGNEIAGMSNNPYYKEDFPTILHHFIDVLKSVSTKKKVILFIDALNQLDSEDQAIAFVRKISRLPQNVRTVFSATSEFRARNQLLFRGQPGLLLVDMSVKEADILLTKWLSEVNRTLSDTQRQYVLTKFEEYPNPLFLKLMFEKVKTWRSWYEVNDTNSNIKADSKGSIEIFLQELENNYGRVMASKSLLYLAISKFGLTEQEWVSIVLQDAEIIAEFNGRSPDSDDVDRLPMHVFSRFFREIQSYLTDRWNEEGTLLTFFHGLFKEAVLERYLTGQEQLEHEIRNQIISHFTYDHYNFRKSEELPWQMFKMENWEALAGLMKNEDFLIRAWINDHYAIYRYWSAIEENTELKKQMVYGDLLKQDPDRSNPMLMCVSSILHDTNCYDAALEYYKPILDKCMELGDWLFFGNVMEKACLAFEHLGVKLMTLMTYEKLERMARSNEDDRGVSRLLNHQARINWELGNIPVAMQKAKEAERMAIKAEYHSAVITSLGIQAKIHKERGEYTQALQKNQKAENMAMEQENFAAKAMYINNQALILKERGMIKEAQEMYQKAAGIAHEIGDYSALIIYLNNMGRIYKDEGDLDAALKIYNEAERFADDYGLKKHQGIMKMNKGVVYEASGKLDDALTLYEESRSMVMEEILSAISYSNEGRIYQEKRDYDKALEFFREAERIARSCQSYVKLQVFIENQASVYLDKKDVQNAQKFFKKADKVGHFIENSLNKVNRNDECPCGSEKKYKKCCMNNTPNNRSGDEDSLAELLIS